ncbi:MAG: hypothetical protein ACI86X_000815 [Moritella sp.]|jgi:hypothetical protein
MSTHRSFELHPQQKAWIVHLEVVWFVRDK